MNKFAALASLVLTTACSGSGDMSDNAGADAGAEVDTTSPSIVSISPADGEVGVVEDAVVTIKFSEPMDQLSVQNSIASSDLGAVSYVWSDGGSTLEVRPTNPLSYAEGVGVNPGGTEALAYTLEVGAAAADEAGNPLDAAETTTFTTLKSISVTLERLNSQTGAGTPEGIITDADDYLTIGDDGGGALSKARRGYVTIDLSPLPKSTSAIASATLTGEQLGKLGDPYGTLGNGSGLMLEHHVFALGDGGDDNAAFNQAPLSSVGDFAQLDQTALSSDVTAQVQDDLAHRAERKERSQYRLRFDAFTNLDNIADVSVISRENLLLKVVYLAP